MLFDQDLKKTGNPMWIFIARVPRPDAAYWPARRLLAAVDAAAWPLVMICALQRFADSTRLLGATGAVLLAVIALSRLRTAIWFNGRYRFTSWLILRVFGSLILVGLGLKLFAR